MELVLVMVVIGVVLGISAPSLKGFFASRQTANAAMTVLSLTKWARSQAISQGRVCRLNVDESAGVCWVSVQEAGQFVEIPGSLAQRYHVPEGTTISLRTDTPARAETTPLRSVNSLGANAPAANGTYVQFYPTGRSDLATIEIKDSKGSLYSITCPSATEPFHIVTPSEGP